MTQKLTDIMEQASQALADMRYADAEAGCLQALALARTESNWRLYRRVVLPLQEARRGRRMNASDRAIRLGSSDLPTNPDALIAAVLDTGQRPDDTQRPGCLILTYPHTTEHLTALTDAAHARTLDAEFLFANNPANAQTWTLTTPGQPAITTPLAKPEVPTDRWLNTVPARHAFIAASEALGNTAIAAATAPLGSTERIDQLERLVTAVPDHELLHQALIAAADALAQPDTVVPSSAFTPACPTPPTPPSLPGDPSET
ncbi:MAG: hypothetical protein AAF750_13880 [Planctomycetota bacterium]